MIYCENIVNVALFFFTPPQISEPHFFSPIFGNGIATIVTKFFFSYFGNGIATISLSQFFFSFHFGHSTHTSQPVSRNWAEEFRYIIEIQHFLSPPFFFFSLIFFDEFRKWWYRNSLFFLKILNNFQQFL